MLVKTKANELKEIIERYLSYAKVESTPKSGLTLNSTIGTIFGKSKKWEKIFDTNNRYLLIILDLPINTTRTLDIEKYLSLKMIEQREKSTGFLIKENPDRDTIYIYLYNPELETYSFLSEEFIGFISYIFDRVTASDPLNSLQQLKLAVENASQEINLIFYTIKKMQITMEQVSGIGNEMIFILMMLIEKVGKNSQTSQLINSTENIINLLKTYEIKK